MPLVVAVVVSCCATAIKCNSSGGDVVAVGDSREI